MPLIVVGSNQKQSSPDQKRRAHCAHTHTIHTVFANIWRIYEQRQMHDMSV